MEFWGALVKFRWSVYEDLRGWIPGPPETQESHDVGLQKGYTTKSMSSFSRYFLGLKSASINGCSTDKCRCHPFVILSAYNYQCSQ